MSSTAIQCLLWPPSFVAHIAVGQGQGRVMDHVIALVCLMGVAKAVEPAPWEEAECDRHTSFPAKYTHTTSSRHCANRLVTHGRSLSWPKHPPERIFAGSSSHRERRRLDATFNIKPRSLPLRPLRRQTSCSEDVGRVRLLWSMGPQQVCGIQQPEGRQERGLEV
jgi:hypothetical protein